MTQRLRVEDGFRSAQSKDGTFSPHLGKTITDRVTRYCKRKNLNRTRFVEQCVNERLDVLEKEYLEGLTKEELIAMIQQL